MLASLTVIGNDVRLKDCRDEELGEVEERDGARVQAPLKLWDGSNTVAISHIRAGVSMGVSDELFFGGTRTGGGERAQAGVQFTSIWRCGRQPAGRFLFLFFVLIALGQ